MATPNLSPININTGQGAPAGKSCEETAQIPKKDASGEQRAAMLDELRLRALKIAADQQIVEEHANILALDAKLQDGAEVIDKAFEQLKAIASTGTVLTGVRRQLFESSDVVRMALQNARGSLKKAETVPQAKGSDGEIVPRAYAVIEKFFKAIEYDFDAEKFEVFFRAFQEKSPLLFAEDWLLIAFAQLLTLDRLRRTIERMPMEASGVDADKQEERESSALMATLIQSLRRMSALEPEDVIGAVSEIDRVLRADPAKAYGRMNFESREAYCRAAAELAAQSEVGEREVAEKAVELASAPPAAPTKRGVERRSHVGFYLIREGR
jgi:cyclic beta-1,2-glucan synthetase